MKKYTLKVEAIKKETADSLTLCFKQPGLRKIKYVSGQYLTLSFRINGRKYVRPYSFSSAPGVDSFLEVTIKRVPEGIVSNYIHNQVQVADLIEVMEPLGNFVYIPNEEDSEICFWGVGSGITPLLSIIKDILVTYPTLKVHLIYGNKNPESTIFLETLNQLTALHSSVFKITHFFTQSQIENNSPNVFQGRINKHFILGLLKNSSFNTKHYICGPDGLKQTIRETLEDLNISLNTIFSEDFELIKDPKDFEDITSQEVKINFQENDTFVVVEKGKSILEAALDAGIDLSYSCQTGNCNTCKGKLKTGELKMIGLAKERDDLEKDDYLLCCSYPTTDNIYIKI
ncbi:ferredoxin--NADP reductase [Flavobacterium rhamnosiphilum]|uniref:Ferredoxin--NADP reductase n=1 Tax=Flavobacterium rhamnosiphilum TaxID=2541724 RepID=A0A4R5F7R9_9FLAO|nr:ferredoxin--NADP reductase [Flavobacterium rhamnosiphilum]TDE43935.1 ferredoxin--NADP reductase [Flavobacterium rhamnosiphilum]